MMWVALAAQFLVFLMWAGLMFRTLFRLTARARDVSGRMLPGPLSWGPVVRDWLRDPESRTERRNLLSATLAVMVLTLLSGQMLR
jgi:hypothetical protein